MDRLTRLTENLIENGSLCQIYHTWIWVKKGYDHVSIDPQFKEAWNECGIFEWIAFRERYSYIFEVHSAKYDSA